MISITDKTLCCGCSACASKCPKRCITMQTDSEGFLYPIVNEADCIDCGLCEKVCHELHPYNERKPLNVYAAINKDEKVRMKSSSGGIFYLLAKKTISEGGVVFGAKFDEDWQVVLDYAETMEDVKPFMGSKYVQARTDSAYKDAETFLKQGRKVLFSGSPCQVAGLHHYLCKEYENLTTVDFVCHGVPSPKVWDLYIKELTANAHKTIKYVSFRNKNNGWQKFNTYISAVEDSLILSQHHRDNAYMKAFFMNMILRPSCYECKAKKGSSHSDITIADYWGIQEKHSDMFDDKGTSLVFIDSMKGRIALNFSDVLYKETPYEDAATHYNPGINSIVQPHRNRTHFFDNMDKNDSIIKLIEKCTRPPFSLKRYVKEKANLQIKNIAIKLIQLLRGGEQGNYLLSKNIFNH